MPLAVAGTPWVGWGLQTVLEAMWGRTALGPQGPREAPPSCAHGLELLTIWPLYPFPAHVSYVLPICPLGPPTPFLSSPHFRARGLDHYRPDSVTNFCTPVLGPRTPFPGVQEYHAD